MKLHVCCLFVVLMFCRNNVKELYGSLNSVENYVVNCLHLKSTIVCVSSLKYVIFQLFDLIYFKIMFY